MVKVLFLLLFFQVNLSIFDMPILSTTSLFHFFGIVFIKKKGPQHMSTVGGVKDVLANYTALARVGFG